MLLLKTSFYCQLSRINKNTHTSRLYYIHPTIKIILISNHAISLILGDPPPAQPQGSPALPRGRVPTSARSPPLRQPGRRHGSGFRLRWRPVRKLPGGTAASILARRHRLGDATRRAHSALPSARWTRQFFLLRRDHPGARSRGGRGWGARRHGVMAEFDIIRGVAGQLDEVRVFRILYLR